MKNWFLLSLFLGGLSGTDAAHASAPPDARVVAVRCPNSVVLLDYLEGETMRGLRYPPLAGSLEGELTGLLARLALTMPERAELFRRYWKHLSSSVKIGRGLGLAALPKEDRVIQPPGSCTFETVLQSDTSGAVLIEADLWERLPVHHQAGALLHWMLARERLEIRGVPDRSLYLRVINSLLAADALAALSVEQRVELFRAARLGSLRLQGILVELDREIAFGGAGVMAAYPVAGSAGRVASPSGGPALRLKPQLVRFHPGGAIRSLRFEGEVSLKTDGGPVPVSTPDGISTVPFEEERNPSLWLDARGRVERAICVKPVSLESPHFRIRLSHSPGRFDQLAYSLLEFFEGGELRLATAASGVVRLGDRAVRIANRSSLSFHAPGVFKEITIEEPVHFSIQGRTVALEGLLSFSASGEIRCGFSARDVELRDRGGRLRRYPRGSNVCTDELSPSGARP